MTSKILITGAGRAGTSFLITALTYCGLDTGYTPDNIGFVPEIRAGCEITGGNLFVGKAADIAAQLREYPRIMKAPDWSFVLEQLLAYDVIDVEHVFLPIRAARDVARSRFSVGLCWHANTFEEQVTIARMANGAVVEHCVLNAIAYTTLQFPKLVNDWEYTYTRLSLGLPELRDKRPEFKRAFDAANVIHRPVSVGYKE